MGLEIIRAEGMYLWDPSGKRYLDLIAGIGVCALGHRPPRVVDAIRAQLDHYLHLMVYGELVQTPQVQFASLITGLLPSTLQSVYFTNSGSEAIEGAMKLAKRYTGRAEILAFRGGYHGSTQGALSILGDPYWRDAYGPLLPKVGHLDFNSSKSLEQIGTGTACVVTETIQAEAGVIAADPEWMKALSHRCRETGTLLVVDEVQCGFGRNGPLWAFSSYGIVPDILVLGKALGGGMPLGAFISDPEIMSCLSHDPVLGHITTFGGHPVCCAAGKAALEALLEGGYLDAVESRGALFSQLLVHPRIRRVRRKGLMIAVEFEDPATCRAVISHCIRGGTLVDWFLFAPHCLRIAPPLIIGEEEIRQGSKALLEACEHFTD